MLFGIFNKPNKSLYHSSQKGDQNSTAPFQDKSEQFRVFYYGKITTRKWRFSHYWRPWRQINNNNDWLVFFFILLVVFLVVSRHYHRRS